MNKPILGLLTAFVAATLIIVSGGVYFVTSHISNAQGKSEQALEALGEASSEHERVRNEQAGELAQLAGIPDREDLLARIARLEDQVEALRSDLERAPLQMGQATTAGVSSGRLASVERDAILTVMAEERERQATERQTEREERELQALLGRASRVAETLGLGADDEKVLADLMLNDQENRREVMDEMRTLRNEPNGRELAREGWEAYQEERRSELASAFGTDLAEQIINMERPGGDRRGGGDAGGFGGGGGRSGFGGGGAGSGRGQAGRGRDQ